MRMIGLTMAGLRCGPFKIFVRDGNFQARMNMERTKTDKEKSHTGIWRSDAPEASQGQTRDVPGTPGTFGPYLCVNQY